MWCGIVVVRVTPRTYLQTGSRYGATCHAAHSEASSEATSARIRWCSNEVFAIDDELEVAGIHQDLYLMHVSGILAGEDLRQIALWERLLIDGEEWLIGLVALGETHAIDTYLSPLVLAQSIHVEIHTDIVLTRHIVDVLEGIIQTEVVGTKDQ